MSFQGDKIILHNQAWFDKQAEAGRIVAGTLNLLRKFVQEKTKLSTLELNNLAEEFIYNNKCTPTFKNYKGFPCGVCISVNNHLVHGIPNNYILQEGDIVKFDLGATFEGAIADSAITLIYGEAKSQSYIDLINTCEESLAIAIKSIKIGSQIGVIGNAIHKFVKNKQYGLITDYGGHGISDVPHAPPFVSNRANTNEGPRIQPGLSIAIEPLLCLGSPITNVLNDKWTVKTEQVNAHFEHSLCIYEDKIHIITFNGHEKYLINNLIMLT